MTAERDVYDEPDVVLFVTKKVRQESACLRMMG